MIVKYDWVGRRAGHFFIFALFGANLIDGGHSILWALIPAIIFGFEKKGEQ